ncbi:MAG TPA: glycosyl hydrolase, partial [Puia sp.]|nr:glycosyl hydrolase [Puia sp.]
APTMTSDGMLHYKTADIPMGEFWLRSPTHDKPNDMLDAISGAHIYGKPVIQAEAFTELREAWDESPAMLKTLQDRNYALGINRMVFHVFTHNPWMDRKPGMTLGGVGTFLQRDQTWWPMAKAWIDYTQRCQWLLQQGRPVADIAVFTGEELPRRAVLPERLVSILPGLFGPDRVETETARLSNTGEPTTKFPNGVVHSANMADPTDWLDPLHGYAFDSFNPDALIRLARVHDGRIELPGGGSYALLVLPGATPMTPDPGAMSIAIAKKLSQLVGDGATILLDPNIHYHDSTVRAIMNRLLKNPRVLKGPYTAHTLTVPPDLIVGVHAPVFQMSPDPTGGNPIGITYTHRTAPGMDIYFVSNQSDYPRSVNLSFRVTGRQPECWDPVTGAIDTTLAWQVADGRTLLHLGMAVHQSLFIVFRHKATAAEPVSRPTETNATTLAGPWTIRFDTAYGGPAQPIRSDTLPDWSRNPDTTIRYYSGSARYTTTFTARRTGTTTLIDLGKLADIATVAVNGIDCGTVWTNNKLDITKALHPGTNEVRITVANTWANRLTGDQRLPEDRRRTWTSTPWRSDGHLLPAGLLGPVTLWQQP